MRITLDVNIVSVDEATPAVTPEPSDVITAALQRLTNIVAGPPPTTPYDDAARLVQEVQKLAVELDDVLQNSDNKQVKNRRGIEIHGKVERAKTDLDAIEKALGENALDTPSVRHANLLLLTVSRALLKGIFGIDNRTWEEKAEDESTPTPVTPTPEPKAKPVRKARTRKAVK